MNQNWDKIYEESFQRDSSFNQKLIDGILSVEEAQENFQSYSYPSGMKIYLYEGEPVMYEYNEINHFILDGSGFVLWLSPASHFEKVTSDHKSIADFLSKNDFFVDHKDGYIRTIPPAL